MHPNNAEPGTHILNGLVQKVWSQALALEEQLIRDCQERSLQGQLKSPAGPYGVMLLLPRYHQQLLSTQKS